jgi:hypothetical protein
MCHIIILYPEKHVIKLNLYFQTELSKANMPPTPQAVAFVFSELWSPQETEAFICYFWPPGVVPGHLRALLAAAPLNQVPYMDQLIDIATHLVMAGHQRSLVQVLQEMGALPMEDALPPIQVFFLKSLSCFLFYSAG